MAGPVWSRCIRGPQSGGRLPSPKPRPGSAHEAPPEGTYGRIDRRFNFRGRGPPGLLRPLRLETPVRTALGNLPVMRPGERLEVDAIDEFRDVFQLVREQLRDRRPQRVVGVDVRGQLMTRAGAGRERDGIQTHRRETQDKGGRGERDHDVDSRGCGDVRLHTRSWSKAGAGSVRCVGGAVQIPAIPIA